MLVPRPRCGLREEAEFSYRCQAGCVTPPDPEGLDAAWTRFLHDRHNPAGPFEERWLRRHR